MNNNNYYYTKAFAAKALGIFILFFLVSQYVTAHPAADELNKMSKTEVSYLYLLLGYKHILPSGIDHILFVVSLFLLSPKLKPVLWQATAFTIAHTITLGLSMYKVIVPPAAIVEPVIALSILYVALENIFSPTLKKSRIGIVFLFGLIHGMGFASALSEIGLPKNAYFTSLIMFNVGVELGQLTVILASYILFRKLYLLIANKFIKAPDYRKNIVIPVSTIIAAIALYWTIERIFFV